MITNDGCEWAGIHRMVNTFLISSNFEDTARILDYKRLGKQRVEAMQIVDALEGKTGWKNHPCVKMWRNHVDALKLYHNVIVQEWIRRGYKNTMELYSLPETIEMPWFVSYAPLHQSHMAALLRKNESYYQDKFPHFNSDFITYGYIWPHKLEDKMHLEFSFEFCDPIGAGAPAQYRWSQEEVNQWMECNTKNPKTGRTIRADGGIAKDIMKARDYYTTEH